MGRGDVPIFRRLAAAFVTGGDPPSAVGYGFQSIQRNGVGDYDLTLANANLASDSFLAFANIARTGSGRTLVDQKANGVINVFTLDTAGLPTDAADFTIFVENQTGDAFPTVP